MTEGAECFLELDCDRDGLSDEFETDVDTDGDGVGDFRDTDSDNDLIPGIFHY